MKPTLSEAELKEMAAQQAARQAKHWTNFLGAIDAYAVGRGIGRAIHAVQESDAPDSPESWVDFCVGAAEEAYAAALESPPPRKRGVIDQLLHDIGEPDPDETPDSETEEAKKAAHEAARMAYRCCMPKLTGRRRTQAYIACVAAGVQHGYFSGSEARSLLYTAQLALAAYPNRRAKRG